MGTGRVKENLLPAAPTELERAGAAQDKFVATLGDLVARQLAKILEKGENEVARVSAGKALLEWMRPKAGVAVNVNLAPHYESHLGLPKPLGEVADAEEVPIEVEKIMPEPKQLIEPEKPGALAAAKLQSRRELDISPMRTPDALVPRSPSPRTPDKPDAASNVKMFR